MYGSRQTLWDMTYLYQEIEDFAKIFNVEARGQAVIADFKNVKPTCARVWQNNKDLSFVFWFSSSSPSADAYVGGKTAPLALLLTCWAAITPLPLRPNGRPWAGKVLLPLIRT